MSQEKVDKYKQEKKNREKKIRKSKVRKSVAILLCAAIMGVIIGFPLGKFMYKKYAENRAANATITVEGYSYWFSNYWSEECWDRFYTDSSSIDGVSYEDLNINMDTISSSTDAEVSE